MEKMTRERYEKPALKFVSLRNEEEVAKTCWGYLGKNTTLYCDIPGEGYCSFQIGEGDCSLNLIEVRYYQNENDDTGTYIFDGDSRFEALEQVLSASGGSDGNPYSGMGSVVIPDHPGDWS